MSFTYATDSATPVHPVSALDYLPVDQMRALQLHRLQLRLLLPNLRRPHYL